MAEKLKLGLVGLGQRGGGLLKGLFIPSDRVEVAAVCDIYPDRTEKAVKDCTDAGKKAKFQQGVDLSDGVCSQIYDIVGRGNTVMKEVAV